MNKVALATFFNRHFENETSNLVYIGNVSAISGSWKLVPPYTDYRILGELQTDIQNLVAGKRRMFLAGRKMLHDAFQLAACEMLEI